MYADKAEMKLAIHTLVMADDRFMCLKPIVDELLA